MIVASTAIWSYPAGKGPYAQQYRIEPLNAQGAPVLDNGRWTSDGRSTGRDVNYLSHTWSPVAGQAPVPGPGQVSPVDTLLQMVKSGQYHIIGRPVVDGLPTLELSGSYWVPANAYSPAGTAHDTVWISADNYLPLQDMVTLASGAYTRTTTKWLAPTPANLAQFQVPVPPGFSEQPSTP